MEIQHLPDGWNIKKLGNICQKPQYGINAPAVSFSEDLPTYLRITDIDENGRFKTESKASVNSPDFENYILKEGDIVFARTGATVGKTYMYDTKDGQLVFAGFLIKIRTIDKEMLPIYLKHFTETNSYWSWVKLMSTRSGQPGINSQEYCSLNILVPPMKEQEKIVQILSTWDEAIQTTQSLIKKLEIRKKGLMQRLLSGKIRLKGFEKSKWQMRELGELITPIIREVPKPNKAFLGLGLRSHGKGTFLKQDFDPEKIEMEYLYQVRENDLIVNITFAWEGAIAIASLKDDKALVSHRFPTYTFNNTESSREYFRHFLNYPRFRFALILISPGGAGRNRVMSKKDFLTLAFKFPPIEEQTAIAEILNTADAELNETKAYLETLKQQKKGLMQQLLTGKIRVKTIIDI